MPNNCLSVLYKHIIQVENKNMGLKVRGGGGAQTYHSLPHPLRFLRQCYSTFNFSANKNRKQNRNSTLFVQTETETETEAKFHNRTSLIHYAFVILKVLLSQVNVELYLWAHLPYEMKHVCRVHLR